MEEQTTDAIQLDIREREGEQLSRADHQHELKARLEQGITTLAEQMQQGHSQGFEELLAFMGRFRHYSSANTLLIQMQCPHATHVAGYKTWEAMGYHVRKGQKGIRILAPRTYHRAKRVERVQEDGQVVEVDEQEQEIATYFVPVSVFDASQLAEISERPLPSFFSPLADDHQELFARAIAAVTGRGIVVEWGETGAARGINEDVVQGISSGGRIRLRTGLDSTNAFLTLIHEDAHERLHHAGGEGQALPTRLKECQAEAVSFIVAYHFGIQNPYSSDYLHSWGNTPKDLLTQLETVRRTAQAIIESIEPAPPSLPRENVAPHLPHSRRTARRPYGGPRRRC